MMIIRPPKKPQAAICPLIFGAAICAKRIKICRPHPCLLRHGMVSPRSQICLLIRRTKAQVAAIHSLRRLHLFLNLFLRLRTRRHLMFLLPMRPSTKLRHQPLRLQQPKQPRASHFSSIPYRLRVVIPLLISYRPKQLKRRCKRAPEAAARHHLNLNPCSINYSVVRSLVKTDHFKLMLPRICYSRFF